MTTSPLIRPVDAADADTIAAIYANHVLHGTASFETEPPTIDFWQDKIASITTRGWPFLVAAMDDAVVGYAYATQFRDRAAYAHTCENSIYVNAQNVGQGIGTLLLLALVTEAKHCGFREIIAVIGGAEPASVALHARCGFRHAGRMENVGYKFGRWLDTVYMQKGLSRD
jgi:L-amino acid N-acyltransferase YncA